MTITDWVVDLALILLVFRQLREARLTLFTVLLPFAIMAWAGYNYLHGFPTAGNDVKLIAVFAAAGVVFGLVSGLLTRVRRRDGQVYIKATIGAAAVWVISMGFRLAFSLWVNYGSGAAHIASFSVAHDITTSEAWVVSLLFMAFAEVIVRMGTIVIKGQTVSSVSASQASLTAL